MSFISRISHVKGVSITRGYGYYNVDNFGHISVIGDEETLLDMLKARLDLCVLPPPQNDLYDRMLGVLYEDIDIPIVANIAIGGSKIDKKFAQKVGLPLEMVKEKIGELGKRGLIADLSFGGVAIATIPEYIIGWCELSMFHLVRNQEQFVEELPDLKNIEFDELLDLYDVYSGMWFKETFLDNDYEVRTKRACPTDVPSLEIVDHEVARGIIKNASDIAIFDCICKLEGNAHGNPVPEDIPVECCLALDWRAPVIYKTGLGRQCTKEEALDLVDKLAELGHCHQIENAKQSSVICSCDKRWCGYLKNISRHQEQLCVKSLFEPVFNVDDKCISCGKCVDRCVLDLIQLDPETKKAGFIPGIGEDLCFGCLVCKVGCEFDAIGVKRRDGDAQRVIIPEDYIDMYVQQAFERGKMGTFLFKDPQSGIQEKLRAVMKFIETNPFSEKIKNVEVIKSNFLKAFVKVARKEFEKNL